MMEQTIRKIIIERLELPFSPDEVPFDRPLFEEPGGLGLDSLSALEILAALSEHFELPMEDVDTADFRNIATLAAYLRRQGVAE